ncbi:MAG: hypothetical protein MUF84_17045, partial [Anaerolineae bacterium]|nr:hypothetical protein [Anaerolineae bacterium]
MSKTVLRLWLLGTALALLIAALAFAPSFATRAAGPAATSTPALPQVGSGLVRRWTPGEERPADLQASGYAGPGHVQTVFSAAQQPRRSDLSVDGTDGAWTDTEPASAVELLDARRLPSVRDEGVRPVAALSLAATTQLLANPGFETGSPAPWAFVSNGSIAPTLTSAVKHSGTWAAATGNEVGDPDIDQIDQTITVPGGTLTQVVVEFWYRITTDEVAEGYDSLCARIWNLDGSAAYSYCADIHLLGTRDWTLATWTLDADQRAYVAGKTLDFGFHVTQDGYDVSQVWLDDITFTVTTADTPTPVPTECVELLRNPQMNVVELGDGTGTIDYWTILRQAVYFDSRPGYYQSAPYALALADETAASGADTDVVSATLDLDEFAQGFVAPPGLTQLRVSYSRLYTATNASDNAYSMLWTLTGDGYLDDLIEMFPIGETPTGWDNRYWELTQLDDAATLAALSGRPLAVTLAMLSNRQVPSEMIWLDDIQVTACYQRGAHRVYLPAALRSFGTTVGPVCIDAEPDAVTTRGSTDLNAVCSG